MHQPQTINPRRDLKVQSRAAPIIAFCKLPSFQLHQSCWCFVQFVSELFNEIQLLYYTCNDMFWIKDDCSFLWNSFCYSSLEPLKLRVSWICAYFALSHGVVANFLWWWWMLGHLGNQRTTFIHPLKMSLQDQSIKHKSSVEMSTRSLCTVGFFGQNLGTIGCYSSEIYCGISFSVISCMHFSRCYCNSGTHQWCS